MTPLLSRRYPTFVVLSLLLSMLLTSVLPVGQAFAKSSSEKPNHSPHPPKVTVQKKVTVKANQDLPGLDTGIDVPSGSRLTIKASGKAKFGLTDITQDCNTTDVTNPNGQRILADGTTCPGKIDPAAVLPTSPVGTLIAKIGSSGWFPVGSSFSRTIHNMSGRLFLLYNDVPGLYSDNSGSYQVKVKVKIKPTCVLIRKRWLCCKHF